MDVAVVLVGDDTPAIEATLSALATQRLNGLGAEVVVARRWTGAPPTTPLCTSAPAGWELRTVDVAVAGPSATANAGLAACRAPVALLLEAGDRPADEDLMERLLATHTRHDAALVMGALAPPAPERPPPSTADRWVGIRPAAAVPPAGRASLRLGPALELDGLDDRLPSLDVSLLDLASRLEAAGLGVVGERSLVVEPARRDRGASLRAAEQAGRSAQALDALLAERGAAVTVCGPARARPLLRWSAAALRLAARLPLPDRPRIDRLAHRAAFARGRGRPPLVLEPAERAGIQPAREAEPGRPPVAVVVPFAGNEREGRDVVDGLLSLAVRPGDELVVVDNSARPVVAPRDGVRVVRATREHSSYHARNAGAETTTAPWLLFLDADCRAAPWILDAHFTPEPEPGTGAVAGAVFSAPGGRSFAQRYSEAWAVLSQPRSLAHPRRPFALTANLLVRRAAWERLGGFAEGVRSAGDADFCWRLQEDGLGLEYRPLAAVAHAHRSTLGGLLRQFVRYGSGTGWLSRRYPDGGDGGWIAPTPTMLRDAAVDIAAARFELALARLMTFAAATAAAAGRLVSNRAVVAGGGAERSSVALAGAFPDASRTAAIDGVADLARGGPVAVEADRRPRNAARHHAATEVSFREDDAPLDLLLAALGLPRLPGGPRALLAALGDGGDLRSLARDAAVARRVRRRDPVRLEVVDETSAVVALRARLDRLLAAGGP